MPTTKGGLAVVNSDPSALATITAKKIIEIKDSRKNLESELESLRKQWRWFDSEFEGTEQDRAKYKGQIEQIAADIKEQLSAIPILVNLSNDPDADKIIGTAIASVVKFINVGKPMTAEQLAATIPMIRAKYAHLTTHDVVACFNKGKSGEYGSVYDKMDGTVLLTWLGNYDGSIKEFYEDRNESQHLALKSNNAPRKSVELDAAVSQKMHELKLQEFKQNPQ